MGKIFEGRIKELVTCSEYAVKCSDFLTPPEQRAAFDIASEMRAADRCFFWGGAFDAQRRVMFMLPEWMLSYQSTLGGAFDARREEIFYSVMKDMSGEELFSSVSAVEISGSGYESIGHRDLLGALLALGIERDCVGDIAVMSDTNAYVFLKSRMTAHVKGSLTKVGRDTVKVYDAELDGAFRIPVEFEQISESVSSERLDGVIKAVYKMSRSDAEELVSRGEVTLNYKGELKGDRMLSPGDVVSVRGYGKFIYDGNGGVNRRGRLKIQIRKYV